MYSRKKEQAIKEKAIEDILRDVRNRRYFKTIESIRLACYNDDGTIMDIKDYLIKKGVINDRMQLYTIIVEEKKVFEVACPNNSIDRFTPINGWKPFYGFEQPKFSTLSLFSKNIDIVEPLTGKSLLVLGEYYCDNRPERITRLERVNSGTYLDRQVKIDEFGKVYKDVDIDKMVEALHTFIPLANASLSKVSETERLKSCEENKMKANIEEIAHKYRLY